MAKIDVQTVQSSVSEVNELVGKITTAGEEARAKLGYVNVKAVTDSFDPAQWDNLTEQKQTALVDRLKHTRNTLRDILGQDGPADPRHIMHWEYAGNRYIIACAVLGIALVVGLLLGIRSQWDVATNAGWAQTTARASDLVRQATDVASDALRQESVAAKAVADLKGQPGREKDLPAAESALATAQANNVAAQARLTEAKKAADDTEDSVKKYGGMSGPTEGGILTMVVLWGALGGSLHLLRSLAAFVGNRQLVRSWILHYFTLPFIGGALAAIVYLMLRVGLVSPTSTTGEGSAIANLNVIAIYGFAALTGLFAKAASDKLAELFGTLFRTTAPEQKDAIADKSGQ